MAHFAADLLHMWANVEYVVFTKESALAIIYVFLKKYRTKEHQATHATLSL